MAASPNMRPTAGFNLSLDRLQLDELIKRDYAVAAAIATRNQRLIEQNDLKLMLKSHPIECAMESHPIQCTWPTIPTLYRLTRRFGTTLQDPARSDGDGLYARQRPRL